MSFFDRVGEHFQSLFGKRERLWVIETDHGEMWNATDDIVALAGATARGYRWTVREMTLEEIRLHDD